MSARLFFLPVLALVGLVSAACGAVATPEWAADAQAARVAQLATSDHLTEIAPTATYTASPVPTNTPTLIPATATTVPATATLLPPTATTLPATDMPMAADMSMAAAGGDPIAEALAAGDPAAGMVVFGAQHNLPDGSVWACASCHSVTPDEVRLIGPGLWNVSVHGAHHQPPLNAVEYIHNSIVNPADFISPVAEGDGPWVLNMPVGWGETLAPQELNDLIAYLVTLKD